MPDLAATYPQNTRVITGTGAANEVQVATFSGEGAGAGTFTLTHEGETTSAIAYNATAATVQAAIEALPQFDVGDVTVTGSASGPYTITFGGAYENTDMAPFTAADLFTAVDETQTVTITGTPTGGTFTLTYSGQTTAGIAYNASAADVATALEALSNIAPGEATGAGGPLPGTPVVITFSGALGSTDLALMTASAASLTGGTTPAVTITESRKGRAGTGGVAITSPTAGAAGSSGVTIPAGANDARTTPTQGRTDATPEATFPG